MSSNNSKSHCLSSEDIIKQTSHEKLRETMEKMHVGVIEEIDERLSKMVHQVLREVEQTKLDPQQESFPEDSKHKNRKKSDKPGILPEKLFLARNSLLTDLFNVSHGKTIYNVFVTIFVVLLLNSAIDDIVAGDLNLGVRFIRWNFGELHAASLVWLSMAALTLSVYALFAVWAHWRAKLPPGSWRTEAWDCSWLAALVAYQACFFYFPCRSVVRGRFPPATAVIVLTEQVRMVMKVHAFVRSNAPRVLSCNQRETACPSFSHFLYFLFCPTLVYRDDYPRTKTIRWGFVAWNFLEVICIVFFLCYIVERFLAPTHRDYGPRLATHEGRISLVFGAMLPSMLAYVLMFYCIIHSWMNAWAEMLRFADRMFYQDWWNATSYGAYYRRWNVVIHDWLYTYVYKDVCETFCAGNRLAPTAAVFAISAIVHEYILAFSFGFFYPMMLFTFGLFGLSLVFLTSDKSKGGNVLVWLLLCTGTGLMTSLYAMEWYSRVNCIQTEDDLFLDFVTPRSLLCVPIQVN